MKLTQADIELIDSFLDGSLDEESKKNFEQRIQTDEEFKNQYEFIKATKQAIRESSIEDKKTFLQSLESTEGEEFSKENSAKIISLNTRLVGIAASIIIAAAAVFLLTQDSTDFSLIDNEFVHLPSDLYVTRSDDSLPYQNDRLKAYSLYEIKSYDEAAPLLYQLFENKIDTVSLYYAGLSYLASHQLKRAYRCLNHPALRNSDFDVDTYIDLIDRAKQ